MFCLFKHAAAQAVRDLIVRTGERVLIERPTWRTRAADLGEDRREDDATYSWVRRVPVGADPGALGVAGYAYYDTSAAGQTAVDLFSKDLDGDAGSQLPEGAPKP